MKKLLYIFIPLLIISFTAWAQPNIAFDKLLHDFGKVSEGDGAVSHDFTFKNTGTAPLNIQDVKTTCGCTTREWTKQPVPPGGTGFVKVFYDVKGRPGAIDKTITVFSNSKTSPVTLRINGEVTAVERHPSEAYRYTAGTIRLDDMHAAFNRVYSYEKPSLVITAYNPGPDAVKISFIDLPPHIKADVSPARIAQGEKASIKISYDAAKKNDWGFVADRISMILNDNKSKDYKLTVTATVEEDFSRWTTAQLQNAPVLILENANINAGKIKKDEKKEFTLKVTNSGKSKLLIRKALSASQQVTVVAPKELAAGASENIIISYDPSGQTGEQSKTVSIITNDPKNANITIRLNAEVE